MDSSGNNNFFLVSRAMRIPRTDETRFQTTSGDDIEKYFAEYRRLLLKLILKAKISFINKERENVNNKQKVRPKTKAPRNKAEDRARPGRREWTAAHGAELDRHDTELRT